MMSLKNSVARAVLQTRPIVVPVLLLLIGCQRVASVSSAVPSPGPSTGASGKVGYVNMNALFKVHPLYPELARMNQDAATLQLASARGVPQQAHAEIVHEEQALRQELDSVSLRTRDTLAAKQRAYAQAESVAIAQILAQSDVSGQRAGEIVDQIAAASQEQTKINDSQAKKSFEAYRVQTQSQTQSALQAVRNSSIDRANREYQAKADEYAQRESTFAFDQARQDADERLLLRTRLSNLALDEQARAVVKARLAVLDTQEADALHAVYTSDQKALTAYRRQLYDQLQVQMKKEAAEILSPATANITERALQTRNQLIGQLVPVAMPSAPQEAAINRLDPAVRARLQALHERYQASFTKDSQQTLSAFGKTRDELSARSDRLAQADAAAQSSANKAIEGLRKQQDDLHRQMLVQIYREVGIIAKQHGVGVLVNHVVAPARGVDLTPDALRDIESLHE